MPIDLSVVSSVLADLLPSSNYCAHLQLNGSVVWFTTPSNSKVDIYLILCHTKCKLLKQVIYLASLLTDIILETQSLL